MPTRTPTRGQCGGRGTCPSGGDVGNVPAGSARALGIGSALGLARGAVARSPGRPPHCMQMTAPTAHPPFPPLHEGCDPRPPLDLRAPPAPQPPAKARAPAEPAIHVGTLALLVVLCASQASQHRTKCTTVAQSDERLPDAVAGACHGRPLWWPSRPPGRKAGGSVNLARQAMKISGRRDAAAGLGVPFGSPPRTNAFHFSPIRGGVCVCAPVSVCARVAEAVVL